MTGSIEKMQVELASPVNYQLPIGAELLPMNPLIGRHITLRYMGKITCVACGRNTSKSFNQGYCYPCFRALAACDMCIMKPETCHFHLGTCREPEWALQHCMQAHYVYLANSSGVKVGITRGTQRPTRWIDQGAAQALPIFRVQTRLQSGLLEVELAKHVTDRTDWRKLLKADAEPVDLPQLRDELAEKCAPRIAELVAEYGADAIRYLPAETVVAITYPVTQYPAKITSLNFDTQPEISGRLLGIKGQYLILDSGVLNIRKFTGYHIELQLA